MPFLYPWRGGHLRRPMTALLARWALGGALCIASVDCQVYDDSILAGRGGLQDGAAADASRATGELGAVGGATAYSSHSSDPRPYDASGAGSSLVTAPDASADSSGMGGHGRAGLDAASDGTAGAAWGDETGARATAGTGGGASAGGGTGRDAATGPGPALDTGTGGSLPAGGAGGAVSTVHAGGSDGPSGLVASGGSPHSGGSPLGTGGTSSGGSPLGTGGTSSGGSPLGVGGMSIGGAASTEGVVGGPSAGGAPNTGGGNSGGARGPTGDADAASPPEAGLSEALSPLWMIDDMDGAPGATPTIDARDGRFGYYFTACDAMRAASDIIGARIPDSDGGRSSAIMRFASEKYGSSSATGDKWGALLGFYLVDLPDGGKAAYDASRYQGVGFYVRLGKTCRSTPTACQTRMTLALSDVDTDPSGGRCVRGGPKPTGCDDDWTSKDTIVVDANWQHVQIPWARFAQHGWGHPGAGARVNSSLLYSFKFRTDANQEASIVMAPFDFEIDDIAFLP